MGRRPFRALVRMNHQIKVLCLFLGTFLTSCQDIPQARASASPSVDVELECHCDTTTVHLDSVFHVTCELRNNGPGGVYFLFRPGPHREDTGVHIDVYPRLANPVLSDGMIVATTISGGGSPEEVRRRQEQIIGDHLYPPEAVLLVGRSAYRFNLLIKMGRIRHQDIAAIEPEQAVHLLILAAYSGAPPSRGGSPAHRELYNRTVFVPSKPIRLWLEKP